MVRDSVDIFAGLQTQMEARLRGREPGNTGDGRGLAWLDWLVAFLPKRYRCERAFVVGAAGRLSDQLDVVIFDRRCSHSIVMRNGVARVPAACVHAIVQVKQAFSLAALREASSKVLSVRQLAPDTTCQPTRNDMSKVPPRIIGCLIAVDGKLGPRHLDFLQNLPERECIDIGCSLSGTVFKLDNPATANTQSPPYKIKQSWSENSLVTFLLTLLLELQSDGMAGG
jgi:uncharacterized protein DUF6602